LQKNVTQALLAAKLTEKLGFLDADSAVRKGLKSLRGGPVKRRAVGRRGIKLAPPDGLIERPYVLHFSPKDPTVHPEQIQKVRDETGLDDAFQRDLAQCRLDAEVAKLLFYLHRASVITQDNGTIDGICAYVTIVRAKLGAPGHGRAFWTSKRTRYMKAVITLCRTIQRNRGLARNAETQECIDDFLGYLVENWDIS
jgi:hypothetical protein